MLVTLYGMYMLVRFSQPSNVDAPMLVILLESVISIRLVHPKKERSPRLVTRLGIMMRVRFVQDSNARSPMLVMLSERSTYSSAVQS